jgi:small subunit ribosomal protein S8
MNYIIGDFIIRIKNAVLARRRTVIFPYGKVTKNLAELLVKHGFLKNVEESQKVVKADIVYNRKIASFTDTKIISKPSMRVYKTVEELEKIQKKSIGNIIVSTNQGFMTGKEALKKRLGGELLFEIW